MKRKIALFLSWLLLFTSAFPFSLSALAETENKAPTVLPAIREWLGGNGKFVPDSKTLIVSADASASEQIGLIKGFFSDMLGLDLTVATEGNENAIIFRLDSSACNGEDEGYDLVATENSVTVTAKTEIGLLYGGISIVQSVYSDGYFPVGTAKDWPTYAVRSGLIDVARTYMPLNDLMDITRYMAWYKLNQIHVHINDNGKNGYNAFRLESDIPGLTAVDGYYTKEEYRQYQRDAQKYGVTVITEFDSPHHARCFATVNIDGWSPKLLTSAADGVDSGADGRALDVRDEKTVQLILDMFDEYLGGDNPVILNDTVHIGMDEYPKLPSFADACEAYLNKVIKHVNDLGYKARFWSSFGENGFLGAHTDGTPAAELDAGLNYDIIYWDSTHSGVEETVSRKGNGIINYLNNYLYVVPGWNDQPWESFEDLMTDEAMSQLWSKWQVNQWTMWRQDPSGELLAVDDPLMLGGSFSLWNDYGSAWIGITHRDVIDRLRNVACFMAEKCWNGDDTGTKIPYADFKSRLENLGLRGGDADIFHRDLPDGGINIDFENGNVPTYVTTNGTIENGTFVLDGTSYISVSDYEYVGMPNTLSFELTLDELPSERAYIFAGSERTYLGQTKRAKFNIYVDPDGTVGFDSLLTESDDEYGCYSFAYEAKIKAGEKTKLTFTCELASGKGANQTKLIVNDAYTYSPVSSLADKVTSNFASLGSYSTLDIPLAKIGEGLKGKIDSIVVLGKNLDLSAYAVGANVAKCADATASSKFDSDNFAVSNVLDGNDKTAFAFAAEDEEKSLVIDFAVSVPLQKIVIGFTSAAEEYEIYTSENGSDYTKIYEFAEKSENLTNEINLDTIVNARYLKYVQKSAGTINEIAAYTPDSDYYSNYFSNVASYFKALDSSDARKAEIESKALALEKLLKSKDSYIGAISALCSEIDALIKNEPEEETSGDASLEIVSSEDTQTDDTEPKRSPLIPIIAGVVVAAVAVITSVFIKKRKK